MQTIEIVRAWKDDNYRDTLTLEQRANLPAHPSGMIDLEDCEIQEGSFEASPVACGQHTAKSMLLNCCKVSF